MFEGEEAAQMVYARGLCLKRRRGFQETFRFKSKIGGSARRAAAADEPPPSPGGARG